jgi:multimeric flavodoxin WrbA
VKKLLIVAHAPSPNTARLRDALIEGARNPDARTVDARCVSPFDTGPEDVMAADGIILSTTENLGYMSGALKDFFDRIYYPCLDHKQGLPYALQIRAGNDGRGTQRAVETIVTGLRWRAVQDALICRGEFQDAWIDQCRELGAAMAVGLESGIL